MRQHLKRHPDTRCTAVRQIEVDVARGANGALQVRYAAIGDMRLLRLPPAAPAGRADELWRTTCFELFAREAGQAAYCELNFAPSTQWAAYRFSAYRAEMRPAEAIAPTLEVLVEPQRFELQARFDLPPLRAAAPWALALSAVIEETNGDKSYWALEHPPGKPDFHHAAGFAVELPAPEPA